MNEQIHDVNVRHGISLGIWIGIGFILAPCVIGLIIAALLMLSAVGFTFLGAILVFLESMPFWMSVLIVILVCSAFVFLVWYGVESSRKREVRRAIELAYQRRARVQEPKSLDDPSPFS